MKNETINLMKVIFFYDIKNILDIFSRILLKKEEDQNINQNIISSVNRTLSISTTRSSWFDSLWCKINMSICKFYFIIADRVKIRLLRYIKLFLFLYLYHAPFWWNRWPILTKLYVWNRTSISLLKFIRINNI